ncbi:MAG: hypothetical protein EOP61_02705 [Sphingomonadales bacterium]|nr:MAG: hypothetical protein EOP61_02705 [Sphingomonadales bacterium]
MSIRNLEPLFRPRSVAVIGGSSRAGTLGERVLTNLIDGGFAGLIYAVNPHRVEFEDAWWVSSIADLPAAPDLAIIVTPAAAVPEIIDALGRLGTRTAVVISSGFHDAEIRAATLAAAKPHLLRVVGPNCLGVLMPHAKLNASFAPRGAMPGRLAFLSQSGALVTAMLDWAAERNIGFSSVISAGDMADVDLGDLIDKLAADPATDAILLYIEGITNAPKFLSAARAASAIKPVVAIKAGRSAGSGKAALSHTGALIGAYDAHCAAFDRAGIVTVDSLTELFDAAQLLCRCKPITGGRLAIVSNGGGAGVLAADALAPAGGTLAALSAETIALLDGKLPHGWSRANPIDVVGDARAERFVEATIASLDDPGADAVLVIHCPTAMATGEEIAKGLTEALAQRKHGAGKPVIACWMGPANAAAARAIFDAAGIALFDNLDDAVRGFGHLLRAGQVRAARMRAPTPLSLGVPLNSYNANIGSLYNEGFEFSLNTQNIRSEDFTWSTTFNLSTNKNRITALNNGEDIIDTYNITRVGESIGSLFGYAYKGVNKANGNPIYEKANGTLVQGNINTNAYAVYNAASEGDVSVAATLTAADKRILGQTNPKVYGGFTNNFTYKGFDLDVFLRYNFGNQIMNVTRQQLLRQDFVNNGTEILGRWQQAGDITDVPRLQLGNSAFINNDNNATSRFVESGNFLRVQNITLGYTIPQGTVTRLNLSRIRVFAQVQNLATITNYKGVDPEVNTNITSNRQAGIDYNSNPQQRVFTGGVNVAF